MSVCGLSRSLLPVLPLCSLHSSTQFTSTHHIAAVHLVLAGHAIVDMHRRAYESSDEEGASEIEEDEGEAEEEEEEEEQEDEEDNCDGEECGEEERNQIEREDVNKEETAVVRG